MKKWLPSLNKSTLYFDWFPSSKRNTIDYTNFSNLALFITIIRVIKLILEKCLQRLRRTESRYTDYIISRRNIIKIRKYLCRKKIFVNISHLYTFILKVIKNIREKCIKFILKRDVIRIFYIENFTKIIGTFFLRRRKICSK